jgi:hypothetical protein
MFKKNFDTLAIYLEYVAVIILECDCSMCRCVDDEEWPFPLAFELSMSK